MTRQKTAHQPEISTDCTNERETSIVLATGIGVLSVTAVNIGYTNWYTEADYFGIYPDGQHLSHSPQSPFIPTDLLRWNLPYFTDTDRMFKVKGQLIFF